jgi:hypothetical protein
MRTSTNALRSHVGTPDPGFLRCVAGYDKTKLDFAEHVIVAVERARKIDPSGVDHVRNPSTGVWQLVHVLLDVC